MLLSSISNRFDSIVQLLTVLLIFIFVLALTVLTTKFTAGIQKSRMTGSNIKIVETLKIAPTKYIQITKIGEKYFSYIVCKETVTLLGELTKDDISIVESEHKNAVLNTSFREVFDKMRK